MTRHTLFVCGSLRMTGIFKAGFLLAAIGRSQSSNTPHTAMHHHIFNAQDGDGNRWARRAGATKISATANDIDGSSVNGAGQIISHVTYLALEISGTMWTIDVSDGDGVDCPILDFSMVKAGEYNISGLSCLYAAAFSHSCADAGALPSYVVINRCNYTVPMDIDTSSATSGTQMRTVTYDDRDTGDWTSLANLGGNYSHPWLNGPLTPAIEFADVDSAGSTVVATKGISLTVVEFAAPGKVYGSVPDCAPTSAPTYSCLVIDGDSSTLTWGKVDTNDLTGTLTVPTGRYHDLAALAAAISAQQIVTSNGTLYDVTVSYDSAENSLTFDVSGSSGWWISKVNSQGFYTAIGYDGSTVMRSAPTMSALSVVCLAPTAVPLPAPTAAPLPAPTAAPLPAPTAAPTFVPTGDRVTVKLKFGLDGLSCGEYDSAAEALMNVVLAEQIDSAEEEDFSPHTCATATTTRRLDSHRALLSSADSIAVETSVSIDSAAYADDGVVATVTTSVTAASSSGTLASSVVAHAMAANHTALPR